jgi:hypothetical protein
MTWAKGQTGNPAGSKPKWPYPVDLNAPVLVMSHSYNTIAKNAWEYGKRHGIKIKTRWMTTGVILERVA